MMSEMLSSFFFNLLIRRMNPKRLKIDKLHVLEPVTMIKNCIQITIYRDIAREDNLTAFVLSSSDDYTTCNTTLAKTKHLRWTFIDYLK